MELNLANATFEEIEKWAHAHIADANEADQAIGEMLKKQELMKLDAGCIEFNVDPYCHICKEAIEQIKKTWVDRNFQSKNILGKYEANQKWRQENAFMVVPDGSGYYWHIEKLSKANVEHFRGEKNKAYSEAKLQAAWEKKNG